MTTLCTVTVNAPAMARDKKFQETQYIARALDIARVQIHSAGGQKTTGNITDDGGVVIGTFSYSPVATS